jgi:hypothetical protein
MENGEFFEIVQNHSKMNSRKDLIAAFQEGSERLTVQPSRRAWQQLEHRLDARQGRQGRIVAIRWLTAIAAMLVLVVGIFFVQKATGPRVASSSEPTPRFLEDLVNDANCNPYCFYIKNRQQLPDYYANPVRN